MVKPQDRHEYAKELATARGMRTVMGRVGRVFTAGTTEDEQEEFAEELTRAKKKTAEVRNSRFPGKDIE